MTALEKRLWTKNQSNCYICNCEFHRLFSWKLTFLFPHHCRICGECICETCSTHRYFGHYSYFRVCLVCDIMKKEFLNSEFGSSQYRIYIMADSKFFSINRHIDFTPDIYGMSAIVKKCKNRAISVGDVLVSVNTMDTLFLSLEQIVRIINHAKYPITLEFMPEKEYYNFISTVLKKIREEEENNRKQITVGSESKLGKEVNRSEENESSNLFAFFNFRSQLKSGYRKQSQGRKYKHNLSYLDGENSERFSFIHGVELKQLKDERAQYLADVSSSNMKVDGYNILEGNKDCNNSTNIDYDRDKIINSSLKAQ